MSIEENKAIVRRYGYELWNEKKGQIIDEIASPDLVLHFPKGQAHQPPTLKKWFETALVAFPNVPFTLHDEIAEMWVAEDSLGLPHQLGVLP